MNSRWKQYLLYASLIILVGGLIYILIETARAKNTGFETKALWDWMELLIIPLFLAGGAIALNSSERKIENQRAVERVRLESQRAEEHAQLERDIATDHQQETALQAYLDRMTDLLLEKKLLTTKDKEVRDVARIRTLTVLGGLDSKRKGFVLRFLQEANLINRNNLIVDLARADLRGIVLYGADLEAADLQYTYLQGADLHSNILINVNLTGADLNGANLQFAFLSHSNLAGANLSNANLYHAHLRGANLKNAIIMKTNLRRADLQGANLLGATLDDTDLFDTNLQAAIMPDGTIHD